MTNGEDSTMIRKLGLAVVALLASAGVPLTAVAADPATSTTGASSGTPAPVPAGPKKRISVAKFDANGAFVAVYGGWDVGGGLAAQLTTALVNSGHFIVVERPDLGDVLREQELDKLNVTSKGSGPQAGRMLGTQLIVRGAVTEFDQDAQGGGLNVGVSGSSGGGLGNLIGGALATHSTQGAVGIDVRLIDATTGQVLQSRRIEKRLTSSDTAVNLNASQVAFGGEQFTKSVLGQATRAAIEEAVAFIGASLAGVPWTGAVADVDGTRVFVNAGAEAGLQAGDRFAVMALEREITDPATGQVLGRVESQVGTLRVAEVQSAYSVAVMDTPFAAKKGDTVRYLGR
jgi:curli biogenesis system outer membrane secretion channel CsgG